MCGGRSARGTTPPFLFSAWGCLFLRRCWSKPTQTITCAPGRRPLISPSLILSLLMAAVKELALAGFLMERRRRNQRFFPQAPVLFPFRKNRGCYFSWRRFRFLTRTPLSRFRWKMRCLDSLSYELPVGFIFLFVNSVWRFFHFCRNVAFLLSPRSTDVRTRSSSF